MSVCTISAWTDCPHPLWRRGSTCTVGLPSGCGLVGVTYVLDEPSIGLHPCDNKKLIATLKQLRDIGNTVIVVEHDEETIWEADGWLILAQVLGQWAVISL